MVNPDRIFTNTIWFKINPDLRQSRIGLAACLKSLSKCWWKLISSTDPLFRAGEVPKSFQFDSSDLFLSFSMNLHQFESYVFSWKTVICRMFSPINQCYFIYIHVYLSDFPQYIHIFHCFMIGFTPWVLSCFTILWIQNDPQLFFHTYLWIIMAKNCGSLWI